MSMVTTPIPTFFESDGQPLENGHIYIGEANLDARTNPIQVYWDAALTVPAAQPIRTLAGYPAYQGAPTQLFVAEAACSVTVQNKNQVDVLTNKTITDTAALLDTPTGSSLVGFIQLGTGAEPRDVLDKLRDEVSVLDFIPVEEHAAIRDNSSTYDCAAGFQAAIDAAMTVYIPNGTYNIGTTIREATNGGARRVYGANRYHTLVKATPALALSGQPIFWFGNSTSNATYRLQMEYMRLDGGDTANEGANGAIGLRAHQCGISDIGNLWVTGCTIAIDAIGCIGASFGGWKSEIYASLDGLKFTAPTGGAPVGSTGGNSTTTTESTLTLRTNVNNCQNFWFSRVHRPIRVAGGLTHVGHITLQNCGNGSTDDLITLIDANEALDYGGGPEVSEVWCEGGNYRSIIRVENTRDAQIRKCFLSGAGANSEQGIIVVGTGGRHSKGVHVSHIAARGIWSRTPSEGRAANYWFYSDLISKNVSFGPNYFTQGSTDYFIDRTTATHNAIIIDNSRANDASEGIVIGTISIANGIIQKDPDLGAAANVLADLTQYNVNGTKVVGAQGAAVANATDAASAITQLNLVLARLRAHGLIAT